MNQKYIAVAVILLSAWFSWFFRYDLSTHSVVLDRWSGSLIVGDDKTILSGILTDKEKVEERDKRGPTVVTPAPEAAMPAPDSPDSRAGTRKGMFDDFEYPADRNPGGMFDDIEAEMSGGKQKEKGQ